MRLSLYSVLSHLYRTREGQALVAELEEHLVVAGASAAGLPSQSAVSPRSWAAISTLFPDAFTRALDWSVSCVLPGPESPFVGTLDERGGVQGARRPTGGALIQVLARYADSNGDLDIERVRREAGPLAGYVLDRVTSAASTTPDPHVHRAAAWAAITSQRTARQVAKGLDFDALERRMPVLPALLKFYGPIASPARLCAWIHMLPTNYVLLDYFRRAGFQIGGVAGKRYSRDPDVEHAVDAAGIPIALSEGDEFTLRQVNAFGFVEHSRTLQQTEYMVHLLGQQLAALAPKERLMIIDDGTLCRLLHDHFPDEAHRAVVVLQTQNSHNAMDGVTALCPIVDMSQEESKKTYEALVIGINVNDAVAQLIAEAAPELRLDPREAAVVGYGAVGRAVARDLRARGHAVYVYDVRSEALAQAVADGCLVGSRDEVLSHGHLTIVATPKGAFGLGDWEKLPAEAIVGQCASGTNALGTEEPLFRASCLEGCGFGDRGGVTLLRGARVQMGDPAWNDYTMQHVVHVDRFGHRRLVLSGGAVVNLRKDLPPEYAQLIRGLLFAGAMHGLTLVEPGFYAYPPKVIDLILRTTRESLATRGLTLEAPQTSGSVDEQAGHRATTACPTASTVGEFWRMHLETNETHEIARLLPHLRLANHLTRGLTGDPAVDHATLHQDFEALRRFGEALECSSVAIPSLMLRVEELKHSALRQAAAVITQENSELLAHVRGYFVNVDAVLKPIDERPFDLLRRRVQLQFLFWLTTKAYWASPDRNTLLWKAWRAAGDFIPAALPYFTHEQMTYANRPEVPFALSAGHLS